MKKWIAGMLMGFFVSFTASQAMAITIGFAPLDQTVTLGTPVEVALTISGLGDGIAPSIGVFDLNVLFNPAILNFSSVAYGDPVLGDQLDTGFGSDAITTSGLGTVNLFGLSYEVDPTILDVFQAPAFTLATLTFATIGTGPSSLDLSINSLLGDALGDSLAFDLLSGSITVADVAAPVPEPSTVLLLGVGLTGMWGMRKRRAGHNE